MTSVSPSNYDLFLIVLVKIGFGVLRSRPEVRSCGGEVSCGVTGGMELSGDPELVKSGVEAEIRS